MLQIVNGGGLAPSSVVPGSAAPGSVVPGSAAPGSLTSDDDRFIFFVELRKWKKKQENCFDLMRLSLESWAPLRGVRR